MRRVVYEVATSLDGFIAGPQGEYDWIPMDPDIDFAAMAARFDAVVMGRRSYEVAKQAEGGLMAGVASYVYSRTLPEGKSTLMTSTVSDSSSPSGTSSCEPIDWSV